MSLSSGVVRLSAFRAYPHEHHPNQWRRFIEDETVFEVHARDCPALFAAAAEAIHDRTNDRTSTPHIFIEHEGVVLLDDHVVDHVEWPGWAWWSRLRGVTPRFPENTAVRLRACAREWLDTARLAHVVMDEDRRRTLGRLVNALVAVAADLGLSEEDHKTLCHALALVAWLRAQDAFSISEGRAAAFDTVLSVVDDLCGGGGFTQ